MKRAIKPSSKNVVLQPFLGSCRWFLQGWLASKKFDYVLIYHAVELPGSPEVIVVLNKKAFESAGCEFGPHLMANLVCKSARR